MSLRKLKNSIIIQKFISTCMCILWCRHAALLLLLVPRRPSHGNHNEALSNTPIKNIIRITDETDMAIIPKRTNISLRGPTTQPYVRPKDRCPVVSGLAKCKGSKRKWVEGLPPLYIITPTYPRAEQIPELTRTGQTLLNVPNVVWIVSEDAPAPTPRVLQYLNETSLRTIYLRDRMPAKYHAKEHKPKGVANRLAGLQWIRDNAKDGVFYFADDDNTYDIRLFEEMRWTKGVSMFPVGLVTDFGVSTPIVNDGVVVGFYDGWISKRKYLVDMAGFAVNVQYFLSRPNATMPFRAGREEDEFMRSLNIEFKDIEPLVSNCTKIWVWHTQTKKNYRAKAVPAKYMHIPTNGTNLDEIKNLIWRGS
ncbi:unnamed protein product, partial [Meganyctiphanes norvegica]